MLCVTGEAVTVSQFRLFQATGILHPGQAWVQAMSRSSGLQRPDRKWPGSGQGGAQEGNIADHYRRVLCVLPQ